MDFAGYRGNFDGSNMGDGYGNQCQENDGVSRESDVAKVITKELFGCFISDFSNAQNGAFDNFDFLKNDCGDEANLHFLDNFYNQNQQNQCGFEFTKCPSELSHFGKNAFSNYCNQTSDNFALSKHGYGIAQTDFSPSLKSVPNLNESSHVVLDDYHRFDQFNNSNFQNENSAFPPANGYDTEFCMEITSHFKDDGFFDYCIAQNGIDQNNTPHIDAQNMVENAETHNIYNQQNLLFFGNQSDSNLLDNLMAISQSSSTNSPANSPIICFHPKSTKRGRKKIHFTKTAQKVARRAAQKKYMSKNKANLNILRDEIPEMIKENDKLRQDLQILIKGCKDFFCNTKMSKNDEMFFGTVLPM